MLAVRLLPPQAYTQLRSLPPTQPPCKPHLGMAPQESTLRYPQTSTRVVTTSPSFRETLAKTAQSIQAPKRASIAICSTAPHASSNSRSCLPPRIAHSLLQVAVLRQATMSWSTRSKDNSQAVASQTSKGRFPRPIKALTSATRSTHPAWQLEARTRWRCASCRLSRHESSRTTWPARETSATISTCTPQIPSVVSRLRSQFQAESQTRLIIWARVRSTEFSSLTHKW